jgi:dTDP-4-amino-4,6-dideoxygalactose transaminase
MNVPYFRPTIGEAESAAVNGVLSSGWLTTGPAAKQFETRLATFLGRQYAVAVNSCTAALHLALEAAGIGQADLVLVPTMTFAATAEVVHYLGARPVLVDCTADTLCIDPDAVEHAAGYWAQRGRLRAIVPMHYGGQMADMFKISKFARQTGVAVIEDAAHALPSFIREREGQPWQAVGSMSLASCFSFYANKCITTGEGGMVLTDDLELADRMRVMSLHGLSKDAWRRFETRASWYYEILEPGFKYNLTDLAASIGCAQLEKANEFWRRRRAIAAGYRERLAKYDDILELPFELSDCISSWHLFAVRLRLENLAIDRAQFIEFLKERGIGCSVHWMPLHMHPFYKETYGYRNADFPVSSAQWPRLISLPIFPSMSSGELDYVCDCIAEVGRKHRARKPLLQVPA